MNSIFVTFFDECYAMILSRIGELGLNLVSARRVDVFHLTNNLSVTLVFIGAEI